MSYWRTVPRTDGKIVVSDDGKVALYNSQCRLINMKLKKDRGYYVASVEIDGKKATRGVHSLMAMAFIDSYYLEKGLVVDHIDGDRSNNNISNLRVVTQRENTSNRVNEDSHQSSFTGVCKYKNGNYERWRAHIYAFDTEWIIGYYEDEGMAGLAYAAAIDALEESSSMEELKLVTKHRLMLEITRINDILLNM